MATEEHLPSASRGPCRAALFVWPVAIFSALYQIRDTLFTSGGDFLPIWRAVRAFIEGNQPYSIDGFWWPPSALLILAPFGSLTFHQAHVVFHFINAACLAFAAALAIQVFRIRPLSVVSAVVVFVMFISLPVRLTLYTENVNGVILAAEMGALLAAMRGQWTLAGAVFGFGLAVKPVLLPLLLLPAMARRWRFLVAAMAVPLVLSALAVPLMSSASSFLTDVVPFLWKGHRPENYTINTSINGAVRILELPVWLADPIRLATLVVGLGFIWLRSKEGADEVVTAHLMGLALSITFLAFSFSWPYYSVYLLPLFVSFASPHSTIRGWRLMLAGVALYMLASQDYLPRLGSVRITCGYVVMLVALSPENARRPKAGLQPSVERQEP
jgi:arabinofuranan 3-O-arabinosyltransferase